MANIGWGHGRPAEGSTGMAQILLAFGTQGGQLLGSRRWAENPLTLTHVRWQGPGGTTLDAERDPAQDHTLSAEERNVWVELALAFPSVAVGAADAPWTPLVVDQAKALAWGQRLRQSQGSHQSYPAQRPSQHPGQHPGQRSQAIPRYQSAGEVSSPRMPIVEAPPRPGQYPSGPSYGPADSSTHPPQSPFGGYGAPSYPPAGYAPPSAPWSDPGQATGSWRRESPPAPEVVVLPCIEVELPALIEGQAGATYRADFARDVAVHFGRAARSLPQVREVRGWLRGDRLILAARAVVGSGNRAPTRAENEAVAQALGQALADRTLPYARLGFADPAEWMHGAALPE